MPSISNSSVDCEYWLGGSTEFAETAGAPVRQQCQSIGDGQEMLDIVKARAPSRKLATLP
jgi:hypothetical protein